MTQLPMKDGEIDWVGLVQEFDKGLVFRDCIPLLKAIHQHGINEGLEKAAAFSEGQKNYDKWTNIHKCIAKNIRELKT